jgi:uncharacterized protein (TIGR00369 family)
VSPVDYEPIRAGMQAAIPYNNHLGLELKELGDGTSAVVLPDDERLVNHVGSQHAGALFSVGEAASGAAFIGAFAERLGEVTPLARAASIDYTKLAKGPITARGRLAEEKAALLSRLDADGKVVFDVEVEMSDADGNVVATMTVAWHVRTNA